jgi:ABC-type branched-subunit amino acid transport system substrate-binding protein
MISASMAADTLLLAGSLSLTGRYAPQGRLAAAGLLQAVQDVRNRGGVRMDHLPELGSVRIVRKAP